jgi:uncharacterized membrane protein
VRHAGRGGVIQAVDVAGLVREAQRADCVVMAARLVLDAPDWHDHVAVGLAEIVRFGAGSPQVARALPPVMGDLRHAVPPDRRAAVDERIALLDEAVAAVYPGPSRAPRPSCPTARASAPGRPSAGRSGRIGAFPGA